MEENKESLELSIVVKPGTVVQNFEAFKAAVQRELDEKYTNLEVSEDSLEMAKAARARLNKAKQALAENMRSAQRQNDEILELPKQRAKELNKLLDDAVNVLDSQIKAIEEGQRQLKFNEALKIKEKLLAEEPEEVRELVAECTWFDNEKWGNKTYSDSQIKKDCAEGIKECKAALQLLTGEFAPQMMAAFKKEGQVSTASLLGMRMQRQKDEYEEAQRRRAEAAEVRRVPEPVAVAQPEPVVDVEAGLEPVGEVNPTVSVVSVPSPSSFISDEGSHKTGSAVIRITCARYQYSFLMAVCKQFGIKVEVAKKKNEGEAK